MNGSDTGGIRHPQHVVDHRRDERRLGTWAADAFDAAAAAADQGAIAVVEAVIEHRIFRIDHRQLRIVPLIADVAPQRGGGAAGASAHHDVFRHREGFARHLAEDAVGDVVVAAPVGGALGVGELIHIVAVQLFRQLFGGGVDLGGVIDEVTAAAVKAICSTLRRAVQDGITAMNGRPIRRAK